MSVRYYDTERSTEEIVSALVAIDDVIAPSNNGKVLCVENGKIKAKSVSSFSGEVVLETLNVTENGDYYPESGVDGFDEVHVAVPGGGTLISKTISQNGTYNAASDNADGYSQVTVNVSGGGTQYEIETDGLVLYFDGYNNTGSGHSGSATTWKDLSGNNNDGIITNGTWDDDELIFNGSSTWVNCGEINNSFITVEALVTWDSISNTGYGDEAVSCFEGGGFAIYLSYGIIAFSANISGTYKIVDLVKPFIGKYYLVSGVVRSNYIDLYINGAKFVSLYVTGSLRYPGNNTVFALGTNPSGSSAMGDYLTGKIKTARLYNRALTDSEILQNYLHDVDYYSLV